MTFPRIIGIMGRSRMGKDSVASCFLELLGPENATIYRLSKTLKQAACVLYDFREEDVEGPAKEVVDPRYGITPRTAIQGLCDFLMQKHGPHFFSKQVFHAYDRGAFQHQHVIIPDIRYPHDLTEIRQRGGVIIKITRPYGMEVPCHAWEAHIDQLQGDYCIFNQGDMHDLRLHVLEVFQQLSRNAESNAP